MIGRWAKPAASRAVRIAPTRPSIMSEGAITSAPARACASASAASSSRVGSLSTSPSFTTPQWPWSVYSQRQTSVTRTSPGAASRMAPSARGMMPPGSVAPLPHAEEDDGRHAQVPEAPAFLGRAIDRALRDARHRPDRLLDPTAGNDEERLHELRRVDVRLPYQAAERLSPAQPPGAVGGKAAHDGARIKASER